MEGTNVRYVDLGYFDILHLEVLSVSTIKIISVVLKLFHNNVKEF